MFHISYSFFAMVHFRRSCLESFKKISSQVHRYHIFAESRITLACSWTTIGQKNLVRRVVPQNSLSSDLPLRSELDRVYSEQADRKGRTGRPDEGENKIRRGSVIRFETITLCSNAPDGYDDRFAYTSFAQRLPCDREKRLDRKKATRQRSSFTSG